MNEWARKLGTLRAIGIAVALAGVAIVYLVQHLH
jgi:uncharacterized protein YjeT (DUF2065 family)